MSTATRGLRSSPFRSACSMAGGTRAAQLLCPRASCDGTEGCCMEQILHQLAVNALHVFPLSVINVPHHTFQLLHRTNLPEELNAIVNHGPARVLELIGVGQTCKNALCYVRCGRPRKPPLASLRRIDRDLWCAQLFLPQHFREVLLEKCLSWFHQLCVVPCIATFQFRYLLRSSFLGQGLGSINGSCCAGEREAAREESVAHLANSLIGFNGLLTYDFDLIFA
mmetsp:Transcript_36195/g.63766  ORF Transcript_36195/g.63766 Transcript_36195/m.63766 type:complete len:224 (-) Transcript_36195:1099-1770(-)